MKNKYKAMRQGTHIRWDALDFVNKHSSDKKPPMKPSAKEARERMIERHTEIFKENPFPELKEPVSYEDAYNYMTQGGGADDARNRMIERQTAEPEDRKPTTVSEILSLFSAGRLTPERAYELYLELNDETEVSKKEMQAILLGRGDSKSARNRMLRRKGYYNR